MENLSITPGLEIVVEQKCNTIDEVEERCDTVDDTQSLSSDVDDVDWTDGDDSSIENIERLLSKSVVTDSNCDH